LAYGKAAKSLLHLVRQRLGAFLPGLKDQVRQILALPRFPAPLLPRSLALPRRTTPTLDLGPIAPFLLDIEEPPRFTPIPRPSPTTLDKPEQPLVNFAALPENIATSPFASFAPVHAPSSASVANVAVLPEPMPPPVAPAYEPRHTIVASALAAAWRALELRSPVTALDADLATPEMRALLDANPADEGRLLALPDQIAREQPGWQVRWQGGTLAITPHATPDSTALLHPSSLIPHPFLLPALRHGRGGRVTRYHPLGWPGDDASGAHLGVYGASAIRMLHAGLIELLATTPPDRLALTVVGDPARAAIYAGMPHVVPPPGDGPAACAALGRALRKGVARGVRPLVLAAIEPDDATLAAIAALIGQLRQRPGANVHLLVAQRRLSLIGRELYTWLPALISAEGIGEARWLPGGCWPRRGRARLMTRGGVIEGIPHLLDDGNAIAALAGFRTSAGPLPPTLWEAPSPLAAEPRVPTRGKGEPALEDHAFSTDPLAIRLARALDPQPIHEPEPIAAPPTTDDLSPWPTGPGGLSPTRVGAIIEQLLAASEITEARPPGVTKGRLAALLPPEERSRAGELMAWLDAAGILADPRDERVRWREPRPLRSNDVDLMRERLHKHAVAIKGS
jgi:hypothetical protein